MAGKTITLPANGWAPRSYQLPSWKALRDPEIKTLILAWARRHGKDDLALHGTAIKAMQRVGNYYHALPKYSQARKAIWEAVNPRTGRVRWKDAFPPELIAHEDNQTMTLKLVNGSTWSLIGSDSIDNLMGTPPVGVVFSEAALANPNAYAFFQPILLENGGWSMHVSSTRGKNHFFKMFNMMKGDPAAFVSHISARDTDVFSEDQLNSELRRYCALYGEKMGQSLFRQEYLSDWQAATVGAVWGPELEELELSGRAVPILHDRRFSVVTSWDIGVADETVILFWQIVGNEVRMIDWYSATESGLDHYAEVCRAKPYIYSAHVWPHDGSVREWGSGAASRKTLGKRLGLQNIQVMPNVSKQESIGLASQMLKRTSINAATIPPDDASKDCSAILETLKQYRFKYDEEKRVMSKSPVHDYSSHTADALAQMAIYVSGKLKLEVATVEPISQFEGIRLRELMASKRRKNTAWG